MADILALSTMQPWCGLIALGIKPVENRTWIGRHRGPVLLHAGRTHDHDARRQIDDGRHPVTGDRLSDVDLAAIRAGHAAGAFASGGIVGEAWMVDCVERSDSDWFVGPYGFLMAEAGVTPFRPCKGALGFFRPDFASRYAEPRGKRARP